MKFFKLTRINTVEVVYQGGAKVLYKVRSFKTGKIGNDINSIDMMGDSAYLKMMYMRLDQIVAIQNIASCIRIRWR